MNPILQKILTRYAPGAAIGAGVSGVENATLLEDSDPKLKAINAVLGAVTGGTAAHGGTAALGAAAAWPLKQMGLLGLDRADKYIDLQIPKSKLDLEAAIINKGTAETMFDKAKNMSPEAKALAVLAMAGLIGAGAGGYHVYQQYKPKEEKMGPDGKPIVRGGTGKPKRNKVRIDVPASALPPEFFQSLVNSDDARNATTTIPRELMDASFPKAARATLVDLLRD